MFQRDPAHYVMHPLERRRLLSAAADAASDAAYAQLVAQLPATTENQFAGFSALQKVGDKVFLTAQRSAQNEKLWVVDDGTATAQLLFTGGGSVDNFSQGISALTEFDGKLYFFANGPNPLGGNNGLYISDGTVAGTKLLIRLATSGIVDQLPTETFTLPGDPGAFYFFWQTPADVTRLYRSDGTATGTKAVWDSPIDPLRQSLGFPVPRTIVDGKVIFSTYGDVWRSDGTTEGKVRVWDGPNTLEARA